MRAGRPAHAVSAGEGESWLELQRRREERMRYEVLLMVYGATREAAGRPVSAVRFAQELGVWQAEVFRVVEWLERKGLLLYHGAGPTVSLTPRGVAYVEREAGRRRSIRDEGG